MKQKHPTKEEKIKAGSSQQSAEDRQELFIEAYIANGGNATQAAISAGYSERSARTQAARLLAHDNVSSKLRARQLVVAEKTKLDTESVLMALAQIVYADPRRAFGPDGCLLPVKDWPDDVAAMVSSIEVDALYEGTGKDRKQVGVTQKVKFWDKNSAIEKAMKHLGQFEKDNRQRNPFETMSKEQLERFIERKQAELQQAKTVH